MQRLGADRDLRRGRRHREHERHHRAGVVADRGAGLVAGGRGVAGVENNSTRRCRWCRRRCRGGSWSARRCRRSRRRSWAWRLERGWSSAAWWGRTPRYAGAGAGVEIDGAIARRGCREQRLHGFEERGKIGGAVHVDQVRARGAARAVGVGTGFTSGGMAPLVGSTVAGIPPSGPQLSRRPQLSKGTQAAVEQALR